MSDLWLCLLAVAMHHAQPARQARRSTLLLTGGWADNYIKQGINRMHCLGWARPLLFKIFKSADRAPPDATRYPYYIHGKLVNMYTIYCLFASLNSQTWWCICTFPIIMCWGFIWTNAKWKIQIVKWGKFRIKCIYSIFRLLNHPSFKSFTISFCAWVPSYHLI